jgi:hypothetical protein
VAGQGHECVEPALAKAKWPRKTVMFLPSMCQWQWAANELFWTKDKVQNTVKIMKKFMPHGTAEEYC